MKQVVQSGLSLPLVPSTRSGLLRMSGTEHSLIEAIPGEDYARADATKGVVNVLDYGADPTAITASDDAVIAAMTKAFSDATSYYNNRAIYFPSGAYLLTRPNVLNLWTGPTAFRSGTTICGDGFCSRIIFRPTTPDAWLYNGQEVPGRRILFLAVRNMRLDFDSTAAGGTVNGFCQNGVLGSPDQGYQFVNCMLRGPVYTYPSTLLKTGPSGGVNTDCNRFINCRGSGWKTALRSECTQSIIHYSIGSDWENMYGPVFDFEVGGHLMVLGGSFILGTYGTSNRYGAGMLKLNPPLGASVQTNFNFIGVKTETWDPDAVLYDLQGRNDVATVSVIGCDHVVSGFSAAVQDWFTLVRVEVSGAARVLFQDSDLHGDHHRRIEFVNNNVHNWQYAYYSGARVVLDRCRVRLDQTSDVLWSNADAEGGLCRMRNCEPAGYSTITGAEPALVLDVDLTGPAGTMSRNNCILPKTWSGFVGYWPIDVEGYRDLAKIKLPLGSTLVSIKVRKAANGVDLTTYQLAVTNGDGSVTYGTSTEGRRDAEHNVFVDNIYKRITTENDQIVKITCPPGKFGDALYEPMGIGDIFIVEYL